MRVVSELGRVDHGSRKLGREGGPWESSLKEGGWANIVVSDGRRAGYGSRKLGREGEPWESSVREGGWAMGVVSEGRRVGGGGDSLFLGVIFELLPVIFI